MHSTLIEVNFINGALESLKLSVANGGLFVFGLTGYMKS